MIYRKEYYWSCVLIAVIITELITKIPKMLQLVSVLVAGSASRSSTVGLGLTSKISLFRPAALFRAHSGSD